MTIWIDAICINQEDRQERESQVAIMRDIYEEAYEVRAWLGPGDPIQTKSAIDFLVELAHREYSFVTENSSRASVIRSETIDWIESEGLSEVSLRRWLDVARFLESLWFSRMWIVQEVVMSKSVIVVCGSFAASFDEVIYYGGMFIEKYAPLLHPKTQSATDCNSLARAFNKRKRTMWLSATRIAWIGVTRAIRLGHDPNPSAARAPPPETVYQMVRHFASFNVTEPRDKVYALLGIVETYGNGAKCPKISYSIPLVNLYWEIIKSHIEYNRNLDFLSDAIGLDKPCGIPTWMPEWYINNDKGKRATSIISLQMAPEIEYKAMANTLPICSFNPRLKAMRAVGLLGAVVRKVGDVASLPDFNIDDPEGFHSQSKEHLICTLNQWLSMLDLNDLFEERLPWVLNLDSTFPSEKEEDGYTFVSMISMIAELYQWPTDKLDILYEKKMKSCGHRGSIYMSGKSATNLSLVRLLQATCHRRLFITGGNKFGLGPKDMQPSDMIVYLYGCRIPMVLRLVDGLKMWRIVGEAYCPHDMNGAMLEPEMIAMRASMGLPDRLFWMI